MNAEDWPFAYKAEAKPMDVLRQFVGVFASKGWLNQKVRIKHRDGSYRIFCSEREFFAYRINENWGIPPGIPGWHVCVVNQNQIIDDSGMSQFPSTEPSVHDWLRCIADGDFEVI
jgi:hypothetical protein